MRFEHNYSVSLEIVYMCQLRYFGNLLIFATQGSDTARQDARRKSFEGCWAVNVLRCQHYQKWQRLWAKEQSNHKPPSALGTTADAANEGVNLCQLLEHDFFFCDDDACRFGTGSRWSVHFTQATKQPQLLSAFRHASPGLRLTQWCTSKKGSIFYNSLESCHIPVFN